MALTMAERNGLIEQYAAGATRLIMALSSETNAAGRIRYLFAEPEPLIVGYDQDAWAVRLDYHAHPLEPALVAVAAVRANTVPLLRAIDEADWARECATPRPVVSQPTIGYGFMVSTCTTMPTRSRGSWPPGKRPVRPPNSPG